MPIVATYTCDNCPATATVESESNVVHTPKGWDERLTGPDQYLCIDCFKVARNAVARALAKRKKALKATP